MPNGDDPKPAADPLMAELLKIRTKLVKRHGDDYERYKKKKTKIINDFCDDCIKEIESARGFIGEDIVKVALEYFNGIKESQKLPKQLPASATPKAKKEHKKAREEIKELWEEYKDDYAEALGDYKEDLRKAATSLVRKNRIKEAQFFDQELNTFKDDEGRFSRILAGEDVPHPSQIPAEINDEEAEKKTDDEKDQFTKFQIQGTWRATENKNFTVNLKPDGTATRSDSNADGKWRIKGPHVKLHFEDDYGHHLLGLRKNHPPPIEGFQRHPHEFQKNQLILDSRFSFPNPPSTLAPVTTHLR